MTFSSWMKRVERALSETFCAPPEVPRNAHFFGAVQRYGLSPATRTFLLVRSERAFRLQRSFCRRVVSREHLLDGNHLAGYCVQRACDTLGFGPCHATVITSTLA